MFTGIIEEIGEISAIQRGAESVVLTIKADKILEDTKTGDSISTNGVCLTAVEIGKGYFKADVMHETVDRSTLGRLSKGSKVNLERAMKADGRFGGHMMSGHIDGMGEIIGIIKDDNAVWYKISTKPEIMRYIIEKGSIAIDGISLTVAKVTKSDFSVSIIPHTLCQTTLALRKKGDKVNLENDMVGKYVEKFLTISNKNKGETNKSKIDKLFLTSNGFM
jgi:riboflavin synthase